MSRLLLCLGLLIAMPAQALSPENTAKNQPVAPFRIAGNLYYVGASDVTSYLVATPAGMILIDGGFAETAPQIERNIATLGFKLTDVKILLNGHAHPDHAGGLAALKKDSGAKFEAMAPEVLPLQNHGQGTFYRGDRLLFDSIPVDRVLHDGDTVELGGTTLTANLTAGHTPGCTTWTTKVMEAGKLLDVVMACQTTLPDRLVGNPDYPDVATDFAQTFKLLRSLPCDVFLAEHGSVYDLSGKLSKLAQHPAANPFIDPEGYKRYVDSSEKEFQDALMAQQQAAKP